ncbi:4-formylbenzenesulfonate dehydrogenase TsaC1/TsaC2 [Eubacteriaceae bacterium CHKCI004]|nr:4-formylbenzenesulfonate dehydrogenase TsaC1/TsaC2 [Eubacteriaceae bacterium CHKCI004]
MYGRKEVMKVKKDVMILTGAGQIGMAIARRMGYGKKIVIGDKKLENAQKIAEIMNNAGFDAEAVEMDLSSRESIRNLIARAMEYGDISMLVNAAGVSPSQATAEELLQLDILQLENIRDTLHAYQMAKRCNEKRVMAEAVKWGKRNARINSISPGIIVTPLAVDELNGPRGDFYKNMFANCPAGRPGTADEVANAAELLMSDKGAFITGADFLIDGGATASYFYGPLKPEK